jgi:hypothetical protein
MKKPQTYGATTIRVVIPIDGDSWKERSGEKYFYDIGEAVDFVKENWREGYELSARINDGVMWVPVYMISRDGDVFVSPTYDSMISRATVHRGNILKGEMV